MGSQRVRHDWATELPPRQPVGPRLSVSVSMSLWRVNTDPWSQSPYLCWKLWAQVLGISLGADSSLGAPPLWFCLLWAPGDQPQPQHHVLIQLFLRAEGTDPTAHTALSYCRNGLSPSPPEGLPPPKEARWWVNNSVCHHQPGCLWPQVRMVSLVLLYSYFFFLVGGGAFLVLM